MSGKHFQASWQNISGDVMAKQKKKGSSFIIFLLVCIIVALSGKIVYETALEFLYPKKYTEYVEYYAEEYGIDETLIYAVIRTESGFDPEAVSDADAIGLMQMTEETFDWLTMKTGEDYEFNDLFTPEVSIKYGTYFLSVLQNEYAITETVIAAYHAGMGNVSSWLDNPEYSDDGQNLKNIPISDTAHYVDKVMSAMDFYYKIYTEE